MLLESRIVIRRTPEDVASFLGDISNIPRWDRGVANSAQTSLAASADGVGVEFDTVAHGDDPSDPKSRGRMSYRITEIGPDYSVVELTNSGGNARFFKQARWTFRLRPDPLGTLVVCSADFKLRSYYVLLAPLFYAMKGAILTDLKGIKQVLEKDL